MPSGYICLYQKSPRSFLFYVTANVGLDPKGKSITRPLAVAYRQGNDVSPSPLSRIKNLVSDILSVVKTFSDPEIRAEIEEERVRAEKWYSERRGKDGEGEGREGEKRRRAPPIPDSPQPPFTPSNQKFKPTLQPKLPPRSRSSFSSSSDPSSDPPDLPKINAHLISALLHSNNKTTRKSDVQIHPPSTPFHGDCLEYGMVVVDISDLDRVAYGIVAFPVRYMAHVEYHSEEGGWDPVEDDAPREEPDVVLVDERPRVPLSILDYVQRHFPFMEGDKKVRELGGYPCVEDARALDYIWPEER